MPASSMCSTMSWYSPRGSYSPIRALTSTFWPSRAVNAQTLLRSRNMQQRTCAVASFREKYQCPELGRAKLEISPSSQRLPKPRSSVSRTSRLSRETV